MACHEAVVSDLSLPAIRRFACPHALIVRDTFPTEIDRR
jgi:hypothetical protein